MAELEFISDHAGRESQIVRLFGDSFAADDGQEEGRLIETVVQDLLRETAPGDLLVFSALEHGAMVGCIVFSRLRYDQDPRTVFILSPVAVRTDRQRQGIGQKLLAFGLCELRTKGVEVAITYGDPSYYSKVGFKQVSTDVAPPPLPLSMPYGWLAQSLSGPELEPLSGPSRCVAGLNKPAIW